MPTPSTSSSDHQRPVMMAAMAERLVRRKQLVHPLLCLLQPCHCRSSHLPFLTIMGSSLPTSPPLPTTPPSSTALPPRPLGRLPCTPALTNLAAPTHDGVILPESSTSSATEAGDRLCRYLSLGSGKNCLLIDDLDGELIDLEPKLPLLASAALDTDRTHAVLFQSRLPQQSKGCLLLGLENAGEEDVIHALGVLEVILAVCCVLEDAARHEKQMAAASNHHCHHITRGPFSH